MMMMRGRERWFIGWSTKPLEGESESESQRWDFLPPHKNNSDLTPPPLCHHGNLSQTPLLLQSPPWPRPNGCGMPAWPGVAVVIRIAGPMLNWADGLIWMQGCNNKWKKTGDELDWGFSGKGMRRGVLRGTTNQRERGRTKWRGEGSAPGGLDTSASSLFARRHTETQTH